MYRFFLRVLLVSLPIRTTTRNKSSSRLLLLSSSSLTQEPAVRSRTCRNFHARDVSIGRRAFGRVSPHCPSSVRSVATARRKNKVTRLVARTRRTTRRRRTSISVERPTGTFCRLFIRRGKPEIYATQEACNNAGRDYARTVLFPRKRRDTQTRDRSADRSYREIDRGMASTFFTGTRADFARA